MTALSRLRARRSSVPSLVAVFVVAGGLLTLSPAPAEAHAQLLRTSPTSGAVVAAPTEVVLTFDEAPVALGDKVLVTGPTGDATTGAPRIVGSEVHQALRPGLAPGAYRVVWRVTSDDGHPVSNTFRFTVRGTAATASPSVPSTSAPGTAAQSQALQSSGAGAPLGWAIAALVLLIIAAALAAVRIRRSTQEKP